MKKIDLATDAFDKGIISKQEYAGIALAEGAISQDEYDKLVPKESSPQEASIKNTTTMEPPPLVEFTPEQLSEVKRRKPGIEVITQPQGVDRYKLGQARPDRIPEESVMNKWGSNVVPKAPPAIPSGKDKAEDLSIPERVGRTIAGTSAEMVEGAGQAAQAAGRYTQKAALGYKKLAEQLGDNEALSLIGKFYEGTGGAAVGAGKVTAGLGKSVAEKMAYEDPGFLDKTVGVITSGVFFFMPGIGLMKGAKFLNLTPAFARTLGISLSVLSESAIEAGSARADALEKGLDENRADELARNVFLQNIPITALGDKLGVFAKSNTMWGKVAESMLAEGGQESAQQIPQNLAANKPITEGMIESGLYGAIGGGVFGGVARMAEPIELHLSVNVTPERVAQARNIAKMDPIAALKWVVSPEQWGEVDKLAGRVVSQIEKNKNIPTAQLKQELSAKALNTILEGAIGPSTQVEEAPAKKEEKAPPPEKQEPGQQLSPEQSEAEKIEVLKELNTEFGVTPEDLNLVLPDMPSGMRLLEDTIAQGKGEKKTTKEIAKDFFSLIKPTEPQQSTSAMPKEAAIDELRTAPAGERPSTSEANIQHEADKITDEPLLQSKVVATPSPIFTKVASKIEGLGIEPQKAKVYATLADEFYKAEASKRGMTVEQYEKQNPVPEFTDKLMSHRAVLDQPQLKTIGKFTPEWRTWFKKSKVVYGDGMPKIVYHGTHENETRGKGFTTFRVWSEMGAHFGTVQQANRKAGKTLDGARLIPGYLSIQNPLRMPDLMAFNAIPTIYALQGMGVASKIEAESMLRAVDMKDTSEEKILLVQKFLEHKGYDGIVYMNRVEVSRTKTPHISLGRLTDQQFIDGFGKTRDSYIAFRPEQFKGLWNEKPNAQEQNFLLQSPAESLSEEPKKLNQGETITPKHFHDLAGLQRGAPEEAMVKAQHALGGGELSFVIEHTGDLIHRMAEEPTFESAGYEYVKNKVKKVLAALRSQYGFEKEVLENEKANSDYHKVSIEEFRKKTRPALAKYVEEHKKLKPFNDAQKSANEAAIALGEGRYSDAILHLENLEKHLGSREEWIKYAHERLGNTPTGPVYQGTRGFYDQLKNLIGVLESHDESTIPHEFAHAWLTDIFKYVNSGQASPEYLKTWEPMAKWLGVQKGQTTLTRAQQEKFAKGFEAFLREGKAPTPALQKVFEKFRDWLMNVYQYATTVGVELSPEARSFYAKMLTSENPQMRQVEQNIPQMKEGMVLAQEPVKSTINRVTGVSPEKLKVISDQSRLLRMKLQSQQKASREAARVVKGQIMEDLNAKTKDIEAIKKNIKDYIVENLPMESRGKFLTLIASAKTTIDLGKAVVRVDLEQQRLRKRDIISDIKKVASRALDSSRVDVEYKNAIKSLMNEIELTQHSPNFILRLRAMREYVKKMEESGRNEFLPDSIRKQLEILVRKPLNQVSDVELETILRDLTIIEFVGREAQTEKENAYEIDKNMWLADLTKPKAKHIVMAKEATKMARAWMWAQDVYWSLAPMDIVFDRLDGGKGSYDGPHFQMKKIIDSDFFKFLDMKRTHIQPVLELAQKNNLSEKDMEEIGIYALKMQVNGTPRVLATLPNLTEEYVKNLTLKPGQMEVYNQMRKSMEETYPMMKKLMGRLYNKDVGSVENYFTMMTDWEKLTDMQVMDRLARNADEFTGFRKNVGAGFSKERLPGAKTPVMVNAMKVYLQHMSDICYFIAMQENIKKFSELTKDEQYQLSVGDEGIRIVQSWFDLLARQGKAEGAKRIWAIPGLPTVTLDTIRKNISSATLGFKLTSFLIQTTSFFDAASYVGGMNVLSAFSQMATNKEIVSWLKQNFPKLRERIGDDLALVDLSENQFLKVIQEKGYAPLKWLDSLVAASTTLAAVEKYCADHNESIDFSKPVDPKAIDYANLVLSKTQASPFFLDVGIMFGSSKYGFGNVSVNKMFLQFKQFVVNRWFYLAYDIPKMKTDKMTSAYLWLAAAQLAELGIRAGSRSALLGMLGAAGYGIAQGVKRADDDDDLLTDYMVNLLGNVPIMGDLFTAVKYGSAPSPTINTVSELFTGSGDALNAQNEYRKLMGLKKALLSLATLFGIPGTAQAGQVLSWVYNPDTITFPYNKELSDLQDLGANKTLAETERYMKLKSVKARFATYSSQYAKAMKVNNIEIAAEKANQAAEIMKEL